MIRAHVPFDSFVSALFFCFTVFSFCIAEARGLDEALYQEVADSLKKETIRTIKKGSERFGNNGFGISALLVHEHSNTGKGRFAPGGALSGDILTGVPYIHITPRISYWHLEETLTFRDSSTSYGRLVTISDHEICVNFNVSIVSDRFSRESLRLFAGLGPSMHIGVQNTMEIINTEPYGRTVSGVRSGLGVMGGMEWPFSIFASLIVTLNYSYIYDWNKFDKKLFVVSAGIAI